MHRYLSLCLLAFCLNASAQTVFIPDVKVRIWLNDAKPNSVDVNGNCDSAAWNAQPPSYVQMSLDTLPNFSSVNFEGVQHLKMENLALLGDSANTEIITYPGHPLNLEELSLWYVNMPTIGGALLPLPSDLDRFWCRHCGLNVIPAFNGTEFWVEDTDLSGVLMSIPASATDVRLDNCGLTQIPSIPNVTRLRVDNNPLGTLTNLPAGLQHLDAYNTGIATLPALPPGLVSLIVGTNQLSALPVLPTTLQDLDISNNQFNVLGTLPPVLRTLYVKTNPLTALPPLPSTLWVLSGAYSGLLSLPALPASLISMEMYDVGLTALPALPAGLQYLDIRLTDISQLPPLPSGLVTLRASLCSSLTCLPALPQTLTSLNLGLSGVTCLPNIPPNLGFGLLGIPPVVCNPGTSPCPIVDPLITGITFSDADVDGVFDAGEAARPNATVIAQPGDLLAGSDINGNYVLPANVGLFSVTGVPGLYEPVTTAPYAVTFTALGQVDSLNHIGFTVIPGMYDLVTTLTGTNVRPGFNTGVWVNVHNVGTEPTTATVQLTFDAALSYVTSDIVPDAVNGNVADWTTSLLVPGGSWTVWVELYGPPALVLGTPVVQQATATPSQPDQTPADNTDVLNDVVVGSFDPNDKKVEPSTLSLLDVASGTRVHYTVRFQNTGTFPAERVLITDTLSSDLQWSTITIEAASHAHTWYLHNGVLHVLFENINLPDSVSDEPGSHGFVKFSFVPSNALVVGAEVGNIANIYFDFNEPVITNEAVYYVETSLAVDGADADGLRAWPNPAQEVLNISTAHAASGSLSVLDITGRVVLSRPVTGALTSVRIEALAPGPYVVRCTTAAGDRSVRFVKR
ncbi:MAG: T9SS type A sorting domain-containing protein [Flavobacteriales bacterium]|nr:T9SS type A sorting domain-containing protein [Flavobacteriales bacterium]